MNGIAVGRCPKCDAMVNICWPTCLVCQTPLPREPQRSEPTPTSEPRQAAPVPPTIQAGAPVTWQRGGPGTAGPCGFHSRR